jgi:LPS-assembly lipoprotein
MMGSSPRSLGRRAWLQSGARAGAGLALTSLLAACGFKLRGEQTFVFDTLAVNPATGGQVAAELRRTLGRRLWTPPAAGASTAVPGDTAAAPQATLDVVSEVREKVVVGLNASGQVREFQLRVRVKFRLRGAQGKELIPDTELLQQRDISFNESAVLAKEAEEGLLYRDMQTDIVQQLLRRLAAVTAL